MGSHAIVENLYSSEGTDKEKNYLTLFKELFERSGHSAHYDMLEQKHCKKKNEENPPEKSTKQRIRLHLC